MVKRGAGALVLLCVAFLAACGKDPGEPSFRQAAGKSDAPVMPTPLLPDTPDPFLIEPIPPNAGHGQPVFPSRPAPEPLRVGGEVLAPIEISRVEPDCAGLHGAEHVSIVELIVSETGLVRAARVLRMGAASKPAVLAAVRQWRFRPATFNGRPVEVYLTVTTRGCP
jgi:hypothetical protein